MRSWAIQLQGIERPGALDRLLASGFDMLVIEPTRSVQGSAAFPTAQLVAGIHATVGGHRSRKLCVAYLNIGQAEDYRTYWTTDWRAPAARGPGYPDFLICVDPDGWPGNYPVAFWRAAWRAELFGSPGAVLDQILDDGFDGIYMDWILGYGFPPVVAQARRDGVDPAIAMVELIAAMRHYAHARDPRFLFIAQNGVELLLAEPEFLNVIDGLAQEDLSFRGVATSEWSHRSGGDRPAPATGPWSTAELGAALRSIAQRGIPVFTLDYALQSDNAEHARATSRRLGLVPFVSRTALDRLPATPR